MSRIFLVLALFATAMMAATLSIGLAIGDVGQISELQAAASLIKRAETSPRTTPEQQVELDVARERIEASRAAVRRKQFHVLFGVCTALVVILVNSISATYFIGTSRWCREVTETYQLDPAHIEQSQRLKRRSFPYAVGGMVTVLVISALGAAADPATLRDDTGFWTTPHLVAALVGTVAVGWAFFAQWGNIWENNQLIGKIVGEVGAVRRERGIDV